MNTKGQTVFVEQTNADKHLVIDVVVIPEEDSSVDELFDLEILFKKSFMESESEWNRSNTKPVIDTRSYKGDLSRYMPIKGSFEFIHVDFDGKGGVAKIIEDSKKFGQN